MINSNRMDPSLLEELQTGTGGVARKLDPDAARTTALERITLDESKFRWLHNEDQMATEKLSDGIRLFAADSGKLEKFLETRLAA